MCTRHSSISRVFIGQIVLFLDYFIQYYRVRFIISINIGSSREYDEILFFIVFFDFFYVPVAILLLVNVRANRNSHNNNIIRIPFT